MNVEKLSAARVQGAPPVDQDRQKAEKTAGDFESMFVRQLVGSLRQTASAFGEDGGMFGGGPGADTYASWFDQDVADAICSERGIGIKQRILADLDRWHQLGSLPAVAKVADKAREAARSEGRESLTAALARQEGIDATR
ncbi:MAG: rod-binding protein [Planctomycetota bacterium]